MLHRAFPLLACCVVAIVGSPREARAEIEGFPAYVTLPSTLKPSNKPETEAFGQAEFTIGEDKKQIVQGKRWFAYLDASALGDDERKIYSQLVGALTKGGWKVVFGMQSWNPPYAALKLIKNGKEIWLDLWCGTSTTLTVIETAAPSAKLDLTAPTEGIAKVAATADFPFLKHFPGGKLQDTQVDPLPMLVTLEDGKDPVAVTTGTVVKRYAVPDGHGPLEQVVVYRDALKAAGWTIVELNTAVTTNDPNLTAHYAKADAKSAVDLWLHVHGGVDLQLVVGDAGSERAPTKLKDALDHACKVAIYGVNFDFDKATLRTDAAPALQSILKLLTDNKDFKLELGGHTDNAGEREYNQKLSEARVATVKIWLVGKGIAAERLTTKGYADTQPIVLNDSPANMAKNRRVELKKPDCAAK